MCMHEVNFEQSQFCTYKFNTVCTIFIIIIMSPVPPIDGRCEEEYQGVPGSNGIPGLPGSPGPIGNTVTAAKKLYSAYIYNSTSYRDLVFHLC